MQMLDAMLRVGLQVRLVLMSFLVDLEIEMFREDDTISNNALISSCEKGGLWEQSLAQLTRIRHTFVGTRSLGALEARASTKTRPVTFFP